MSLVRFEVEHQGLVLKPLNQQTLAAGLRTEINRLIHEVLLSVHPAKQANTEVDVSSSGSKRPFDKPHSGPLVGAALVAALSDERTRPGTTKGAGSLPMGEGG